MWPLVASWATDTNIDSGCGRTMILHMVHISNLGSDVTMTWVAVQAIQMVIAAVTAWFSDANMVPGSGPDPWHRHGLQWYQNPRTSAQTLALAGPQ